MWFGDQRLPERFWAKVLNCPATGCWLWRGYVHKSGHGRLTHEQRSWGAHRFAYYRLVGPPPTDTLDHLCRTPACVNPGHMEPVSRGENVLRGVGFAAENARKTHCPKGHEYTPGNTRRNKIGWRWCIECSREKDRLRSRSCASI